MINLWYFHQFEYDEFTRNSLILVVLFNFLAMYAHSHGKSMVPNVIKNRMKRCDFALIYTVFRLFSDYFPTVLRAGAGGGFLRLFCDCFATKFVTDLGLFCAQWPPAETADGE